MSTLSVLTIAQDEEECVRWYLECCVHLSQHLGDGLREVVIVDGGSKDLTVDVVKSYTTHLPVKLLHRPFDNPRDQQNFGLDSVTGEYVFGPDADMTWTTNLPMVFQSGRFLSSPFWDFPMLFTAQDAYHFFHKWPHGVNMRLWRRGPKFRQDAKFHVKLEGQPASCPVASDVVLFENSCRIKNEAALYNRGLRRQPFAAEMAAEGASPGAFDRFYGVSQAPDSEIAPLPPHVANLVLASTNR